MNMFFLFEIQQQVSWLLSWWLHQSCDRRSTPTLVHAARTHLTP